MAGELPPYDIGKIFTAEGGPLRDRERYLACLDVVQHLTEWYARPPAPVPVPGIAGVSFADLRQRAAEQPAFARMFGGYRDLVLRHEGDCARRLECLRSTTRTLVDLRTRCQTPETIDHMLDALGAFVAQVWNVDIPLDVRDRDWALNASRRYDLLSPSLRYV